MLSIGALARRSGVKVPTIRYYEQLGLIDAPVRSDGNQRRYTDAQAQRLGFIRHARDLGLSLDAIRDLLRLCAPALPDCNALRRSWTALCRTAMRARCAIATSFSRLAIIRFARTSIEGAALLRAGGDIPID